MSDTYYDDDNYDGPAGLREALKKANARLKELEKANEGLQAENVKLSKSVKSTSLTTILRDKGVKPALAKWLEKDEVDATPEAVDAWLAENGEFFNVKPTATEPEGEQSTEEPQGQANVSPELEAQIRAGQTLDASGVSPSEVDAMQKLQSIDPTKFSSFEELQAAISATGIKLG